MSNLGQAKPASEAVEGTASDQAQLNERKFNAAFAESVCNDTVINWRYWVEQMPRISAAEAARLCVRLTLTYLRASTIDPTIMARATYAGRRR